MTCAGLGRTLARVQPFWPVATMKFSFVTSALAVSIFGAAITLAGASDFDDWDKKPPEPTPTSRKCADGEAWDDKSRKCVKLGSRLFDDLERESLPMPAGSDLPRSRSMRSLTRRIRAFLHTGDSLRANQAIGMRRASSTTRRFPPIRKTSLPALISAWDLRKGEISKRRVANWPKSGRGAAGKPGPSALCSCRSDPAGLHFTEGLNLPEG